MNIDNLWNLENFSIDDLNIHSRKGLMEIMKIKYSHIDKFELWATMPVDINVQPMGLLHGGAHCVIGESLGSVSSVMSIDRKQFYPAGTHLSATHVKSARVGIVTAKCKLLNLGNRNHQWQTKVYDQDDNLLSIINLSVAILRIKK